MTVTENMFQEFKTVPFFHRRKTQDREATFVEGIILEVVGKKGILRIDLKEDEIKKTTDQNRTEVKKQ